MAERNKPHVHPVDDAWLALGVETAAEPTLAIIDSHIHLWDFSNPPYFADVYARDAQEAGISASVFVECGMSYRQTGPAALEPVGEVEFASNQAAGTTAPVTVAAAIMGWADLGLGESVGETMDALQAAGGGRFRGVRCRAAYDPDPAVGYGPSGAGPGLMAREDFRRGVAELHARGHVLDVYAFHTQLDETADLARAFPDLPIVLNHIGGPLGVGSYARRREQVFADWAAGLTKVAACPNVSIKVGGFAIARIAIIDARGTDRPPSSAEVADVCQPWVAHCLAQFGAQRSMFGSNFPVDKSALPLRTLVNAMKRLTAGLSADEQQAFFADNARRIYRI